MLMRVWDVTFTVSDLERRADSYEGVLELPKKYPYATYAGFDCGGVEIGLMPGQVAGERAGVDRHQGGKLLHQPISTGRTALLRRVGSPAGMSELIAL